LNENKATVRHPLCINRISRKASRTVTKLLDGRELKSK